MEDNEDQLENLSGSSQEMFEKKHFDFEQFCHYMKKSILENPPENDDVELESYLLAYEQLHNFFLLLGAAFQFVAIDVKSKIKILKSYQKSEGESIKPSKNFLTVKSMVDYEEKNKLLTNPKYVSGCRTLLRLHRGLDFVRRFLEEIYKLENDVKLCNVARDIYNQTLAEYHTWVVRNAARMAMKLLPSRMKLLKQTSTDANDEKFSQVLALFPDAIEAMNKVYNRVQGIYTVNKLLELP